MFSVDWFIVSLFASQSSEAGQLTVQIAATADRHCWVLPRLGSRYLKRQQFRTRNLHYLCRPRYDLTKVYPGANSLVVAKCRKTQILNEVRPTCHNRQGYTYMPISLQSNSKIMANVFFNTGFINSWHRPSQHNRAGPAGCPRWDSSGCPTWDPDGIGRGFHEEPRRETRWVPFYIPR